LTEEEPDSLLERLLEGDFTELNNVKEHEVMDSNVSLSEMSKAGHDKEENIVEENIIEYTLEELADNSEMIQQFESKPEDKEDLEIVVPEQAIADLPEVEEPEAIEDAVEADLAILLAKQEIENVVEGIANEEDLEIEEEGQIIEQERHPDKQVTDNEAITTETTLSEESEDEALTLDDLQEEDKKSESATIIDLEIESKVEEEPEIRPSRPKPLPKSSFNSWLQQYRSPILESRLEDFKEVTDKKQKKKKRKAKEKATIVVAKASIREDNEIASETLASLLEKQGHYQRAIKMYHTLRLRNPEKNGFFAAKIEALQEELDKQ